MAMAMAIAMAGKPSKQTCYPTHSVFMYKCKCIV